MEILGFSTLKWKMQAVTPFPFIDYSRHKISVDKIPPKTSILLSVQLILSAIKGESQTVDVEGAISFIIQHVKRDRAISCSLSSF